MFLTEMAELIDTPPIKRVETEINEFKDYERALLYCEQIKNTDRNILRLNLYRAEKLHDFLKN